MKCEDFIRLIDAYIDGELDETTVSEMLSHAKECENCAQELSMAEMLRDTLSGIDEDTVPPIAAQAAWRNAIKVESRKKRMNRIYKICASAAAAVVIMFGLYAGLDAFDMKNAQQPSATETTADAGFVFVAADGGDATPNPAARTITMGTEDEAAGNTASVMLTAADTAAASESIISMAEEFYGYAEAHDNGDTALYLTAYIPVESIDQFVSAISVIGEITDYQFNEGDSANVVVTITLKTAE